MTFSLRLSLLLGGSFFLASQTTGFVLNQRVLARSQAAHLSLPALGLAEKVQEATTTRDDGVIELGEEETPFFAVRGKAEKEEAQVAPFLSQGEILPESLNPDLADPKQTRVIIYTIISLIPVLFLIPLMLASRDLIPLEMLPPVEMNM